MKILDSILLSGTLIGRGWWPQQLLTKEFQVKFSAQPRPFTRDWEGLREALLHLTNDGDFQSSMILDEIHMSVTWLVVRNGEIKQRINSIAWLESGKLVEEFITHDPESEL